jgi:hypothetical protein
LTYNNFKISKTINKRMKHIFRKTYLFIAALAVAFAANAQTANIQVIHNSADAAASTVDVYVNGVLTFNDFAFRTATPYTSVPSGVTLEVGVAPGNSTSVNDTIKTFTLGPLTNGENYVIMADGVIGGGFAANPNSLSTAFDLKVFAGARTTGVNPALVDILVHHGATDAPGVDVRVRSGGPLLVNNAKYGDFSGYLPSLPPYWYALEVIAEDSSSIVGTWIANVSALAGQSAVVFASGFVTPAVNNGGPAFGLFAALANGTVVALEARTTANIQFIHNAADPALDSVDVYINGAKFFDNFAFRTATPYLQGVLTANFPITVGFAPKTSTSVLDTIWTNTYFFTPGETYVAVASGVANPANFATNPSGNATDFDVLVYTPANISAANPALFEFIVVHGSTDAPTIDLNVRSGGPNLVNNAEFGDITNYIAVPPSIYALSIINGDSSGTSPLYEIVGDFTALGGQTAVVFASGFITPANNQNGASFKIFAALATGQVVEIPQRQSANVQFIHNAPDPALDTVDVYVNGALYFNNFVYHTATPMLSGILTANFPYEFGFAPYTSTSVNDTIWRNTYFFAPNQTYIAIASGVANPAGFAANPSGNSTAFDVIVKNPAQTSGAAGNFDFYVVHGSPDAPTVDVSVRNGVGNPVVNDAAYSNQTGYLSVPADNYILDVQDATGATTLVSYVADVTTLAGQSGVIYAGGFLNPAANQNGPAFGLFLTTVGGGASIPLPLYIGLDEIVNVSGVTMFPNPTNGNFNIMFNLETAGNVTVDITDLNGRVVKNVVNGTLQNGQQNLTTNLSDVANGMYIARIINGSNVTNVKFTVAK